MSRYEVLFLDADYTLFNTTVAKREAFIQATTGCFNGPPAQIYEAFGNYHLEQQRLYQPDIHSKSDLFAAVFRNLFAYYHLALDEHIYSAHYLNLLGNMVQLIDGVENTCRELSHSYRLIIISNDIAPGITRKRVEQSRIASYISHIISSDEVGVSKPDAAIFSLAMEACNHPPKDKVLMVGDSLKTDIDGAARFGLDTCWFVPPYAQSMPSVKPDYTISTFSELLRIVSEPRDLSPSS